MRPRILPLLALAAILGTACADDSEASSYLGDYIQKFYPGAEVIASECQNKDSDGDGYVSCTVRLKEPLDPQPEPAHGEVVTKRRAVVYGDAKVVGVECAASWPWQVWRWFQTGCRTPKIHGG